MLRLAPHPMVVFLAAERLPVRLGPVQEFGGVGNPGMAEQNG